MEKNFILVTGGAGYIGSHTCVELIKAGYDLLVLDNLCNSSAESLNRVAQITATELNLLDPFCLDKTNSQLNFIQADIRDKATLRSLFSSYQIQAVIHFAGLKAVGESVEQPLKYYDNNVSGTVSLLEIMQEFACQTLVFSSSATVYGDPASVPIKEDFPLATTNPYGASKLMVENILRDLYKAGIQQNSAWAIALLRYFNPVGAHESGLIGEDPNGIPNNLMPFVAQVAVGKREKLSVFGSDYPTPDGTGVRDYIHVVDLAKGHIAALKKLLAQPDLVTVNLGTGRGYSVLEMVAAFEKASGKKVAYQLIERRPGDVAQCYAEPALAKDLLGWQAEYDIDKMCADAWNWQTKNPDGYK